MLVGFVVGPGAVAQIVNAVVSHSCRSMADVVAQWTGAYPSLCNQRVHHPCADATKSVPQVDLEIPISIRSTFEDFPLAAIQAPCAVSVYSGYVPGNAPDFAKVAHLVQELPPHNWTPLIHLGHRPDQLKQGAYSK